MTSNLKYLKLNFEVNLKYFRDLKIKSLHKSVRDENKFEVFNVNIHALFSAFKSFTGFQ